MCFQFSRAASVQSLAVKIRRSYSKGLHKASRNFLYDDFRPSGVALDYRDGQVILRLEQ